MTQREWRTIVEGVEGESFLPTSSELNFWPGLDLWLVEEETY